MEGALLSLWREFFDSPKIEPGDNFFECGGNSLLAARLATLVTARLGRPLSPADILAYPSVRSLAGMLEGGAVASQQTEKAKRSIDERALQQRGAFARKRAVATQP